MPNDTIPTARLEEIRELAAKATPGKRVFFADEPKHRMTVHAVWTLVGGRPHDFACAAGNAPDAAFIARLDPQTISAIVSELIERRNKDAEHG